MPKPKKDEPESLTPQQRVDWILLLRPDLPDKPEFVRVAAVLGYFNWHRKDMLAEEACEMLSIMVPENKEFWLRVDATIRDNFINGLKNLFSQDHEEQEKLESQTGASVGVKST